MASLPVFGSHELPEHDISDERVAEALVAIKRQARDRRIAMVAPLVLAAAVMVAFVAAPQRHGGLVLVPEADASDDAVLPQVFGANGVWRLAEPIGEPALSIPGPPWMISVPDEPASPEFILVGPDEDPLDEFSNPSLPMSASTPPAPTSGQSTESTTEDPEPIDWTEFQPEVRLDPVDPTDTATEPTGDEGAAATAAVPADDADGTDAVTPDPAGPQAGVDGAVVAVDDASGGTAAGVDPDAALTDGAAPPVGQDPAPSVDPQMSPAPPAANAEEATSTNSSSPDEDVPPAAPLQSDPTGDGEPLAPVADGSSADTGNRAEANPSTPQLDSSDQETPSVDTVDALATIVFQSVLVHRANVSVTVQVVDDDSSVIDWCNTRVDWGDGSVTGLLGPDGGASCAAPCEREASPSASGVNESITFTHEYSVVIDAAPQVVVATGDGCNHRLAVLQLNAFTVVPY
ncbi:MAG: hypothetical protein AAF567_26635 [Actinomycetota bacterium]